jgi:GNAT superfamily N-acetyltransferase
MLDYVPLTAHNFAYFEQDVMASEAIFPPEIRESAAGYLDALRQDRALGIVARLGRQYAGNAVGFRPDAEQVTLLRLDEIGNPVADLIYLFNIVMMPGFQGKGLGKALLHTFLDRAQQAGFRKVGGHFRCNGSLKNFKTLGGEELGAFDNWFDTGERYIYCELDMERLPVARAVSF